MGLRPGHCYSDPNADRAYTRVAMRVPKKNFVGTNPVLRIRQFNMGNPVKEYNKVVDLYIKSSSQIRDNALEAARTAINRILIKNIGKENFFMKLRVYPFHILRENKQAQGAGADRVSQGMSHSFGKPIGRAARVKKNQVLFSVLVDENSVDLAIDALKRAKSKFSAKIGIRVHDDIKSIGTRPKKVRVIEEVKPEEEEGKEAKEGAEGKEVKGVKASTEGKEVKEEAEGKKAKEKTEKKGSKEKKGK